MHKRSKTPHIIVFFGALASCADPGAPDGDGASTEATTQSTTTTTSDAPTSTSLAESTSTTSEEPGATTEGSATTSAGSGATTDESGTTSEGDPQIFKNCAEGNALQAEMQAWSCGCSVEAGDYPTLRECLEANSTTPEEDACTCEVFAADPQNGAFVACQTEAFAAFVACIAPLACADDGGIEACYAQLGSASTICEQPVPDVFREISMKCEG
ncbi:hypothetical protein OV203_31395 [Nannocystis sp. ILAH1]|uniref:hypothetical protein n=1 Tax=Nannocystis sp. ILAH1 TaxID=2996789 RepID=UPI00226DFF70|nr:hypothetical protein [Nannocystis sp. ILAH1]MCY0991690.1 hypothetical protein [Nannocystis sp. ILAH1]